MGRSTPPNLFESPPDRVAETIHKYGGTVENAPAGHVLLRQGDTADRVYVMRHGMVCAAIDMEDKKYTLDVFVDGYVFTSIESFMFQVPSAFSLEVVIDSEYVVASREMLELLSANRQVRQQLRVHHQLTIARMTRRLIEMMTTSPEERYLRFVEDRSDLINHLPQYMIASMLGISPESLSRVRRRLSSKRRRERPPRDS